MIKGDKLVCVVSASENLKVGNIYTFNKYVWKDIFVLEFNHHGFFYSKFVPLRTFLNRRTL
jgi:hypothetical protein